MNLKNELIKKAGWWCTPANMRKLPSIEKELMENGSIVLVADEVCYEVSYFKATGKIEVKNNSFTGKRSYSQYN